MKGKRVFITIETFGGNIANVRVYEKEIDADTNVIKWRNEHGITSDEEAQNMDDNKGTAVKEFIVEVE